MKPIADGIAFDNLATENHPVWRRRHMLPLTPQAVRAEQVEAGIIRRTPLDALLTDAEAQALERYAANEDMLRGNARAQDYCGDRVQTSRQNMAPIHDDALPGLRAHAMLKQRLPKRHQAILTIFCFQQWRDPQARSDAQLGLLLAPRARDKGLAWRLLVAQTAAWLAK
jgi:hypothetical protein